MDELVKLAGSRGYKVSPEAVPTAVETLEHLEQTLDNLDPVPTTAPPVGEIMDAAADAVIADVTGDPSVEAVEPVNVPSGTGEPNTSATHDEPTGP